MQLWEVTVDLNCCEKPDPLRIRTANPDGSEDTSRRRGSPASRGKYTVQIRRGVQSPCHDRLVIPSVGRTGGTSLGVHTEANDVSADGAFVEEALWTRLARERREFGPPGSRFNSDVRGYLTTLWEAARRVETRKAQVPWLVEKSLRLTLKQPPSHSIAKLGDKEINRRLEHPVSISIQDLVDMKQRNTPRPYIPDDLFEFWALRLLDLLPCEPVRGTEPR